VIAGDPNVASVELVAAALGDLCEELVLVGGCAASLLIDAPTAPPPRVTYDVDLIAAVAALRDYHALERRFSQHGFSRDLSADAPICRWKLGAIEVDLMPTDETVLGFSNRWYTEAVSTATRLALPSGTTIRLISAPAFLATKFEAFRTRGEGDLMTSHDFEDIINVVEGRSAIVDEVAASGDTLRAYLVSRFAEVLAAPDFGNVLPGLIAYDELHGQRLAAVMKKISAIAAAEP
jgi:predicted nucleotidyltransferase